MALIFQKLSYIWREIANSATETKTAPEVARKPINLVWVDTFPVHNYIIAVEK